MSISIRARRTALALFATALIAASCALPGYDVGESSSGTTATGSTGTAGGSTASTGTGGTGGAGQGGGGEGGGEGGAGGAGGNSAPMCPDMPPEPNSACPLIGLKCPFVNKDKTCCIDEYKCVGNDPATAGWVFGKTVCPPPDCPQDCGVCPAEPPPAGIACPCRTDKMLICNYNQCPANAGVPQWTCAPAANPGGMSTWVDKGVHECCEPGASGQCQGCATHEDVNGSPVSFCP